jgi:hypothetical protein
MALRLRRGIDAERLLMTPVEGELIYTTDTKLLYVGDGVTAGGKLVTGAGGGGSTTLDALTDTDLTGVENNQVLTYLSGTNKWEPTTLPGVGALALNDLTNVNTGGVATWDVLQYDGVNFVPKSIDEALATDNDGSIEINTVGIHTGNVVGNVTGDLVGSVFSDDSSILVDGVNNTITAASLTTNLIQADDATTIKIESGASGTALSISGITSGTFGGESSLSLDSSKGTLDNLQDTGANDIIGAVKVRGYNNGNYVLGSLQQTFWDASADFGDTYPKSGWRLATNAGDGKGTLLREDGVTPSGFNHMTLRGDGVVEGPIFKMNVVADSTSRDALITAPEAGMTVFVTDGDGAGTPKFQGYDGSAWVNLN